MVGSIRESGPEECFLPLGKTRRKRRRKNGGVNAQSRINWPEEVGKNADRTLVGKDLGDRRRGKSKGSGGIHYRRS